MKDGVKAFLVLGVCLFLVFIMADCSMGNSETVHGVVHKMEHIQSKQTRHWDSDDDEWDIRTEPEKWVIYVRLDNGDVADVETNKKVWVRLKENDETYVSSRVGRFSGMRFFSSICEAEKR
jgi:hypothetical protein